MRLPDEIRALYPEDSDTTFAVRHYCMSCVGLRLLGTGWEPQINAFDDRDLKMLAALLPVHARAAIYAEIEKRNAA